MPDSLTLAKDLLELAASPRPKYLALHELVSLGVVTRPQIAELRSAGMRLYEFEGMRPEEPRVWCTAQDFVEAATIVASFPAEGDPGCVH